MITIGGHYRGSELETSFIRRVLSAVAKTVAVYSGERAEGSEPTVNVVFYVPGSLGRFEIPRVEASRFSRKQKLLLVAVPVPPEMVNSSGALDFVMDSLHKANAIAAEVFAKKNVGIFDLAKGDELVEKARAEIATGKYEKQVADAIAKMSESTQNALAAIAKAKEASANKPK